MLPFNDVNFQPPFLGLKNEEEVISALDTIMPKETVTKSKTESEKNKRRENIQHWNSVSSIFFVHFFNFISQQQKTGAGRRITVPAMDKQLNYLLLFIFLRRKRTMQALSVIKHCVVPYYNGKVIYLEYIYHQKRK